MKILLACSSGMSTSLLVNKMKEAAQAEGIEAEIWAVAQSEVDEEIKKADVLKKKYEPKGKELNIPVDVVPPMLYGRCDGKGVLKLAMDLVNNK